MITSSESNIVEEKSNLDENSSESSVENKTDRYSDLDDVTGPGNLDMMTVLHTPILGPTVVTDYLMASLYSIAFIMQAW